MNSATFPIVEIDDHKLIALDGNVAYFYELISPDFEQYSPFERERFFEGISGSLNYLSDDHYFKFYRIDNRNFVETNKQTIPELRGIEFFPCKDHLLEFFKSNEIISDVGIFNDYLLINGKYLKVFSVREFSEKSIDESLIPLDLDYVLKVKKVSKEKSVKQLEKVRDRHLTSFSKNKRDVVSEGAYRQAEELLDDLAYGQEAIFEIELFFILRGDSTFEVNELAMILQGSMASKGIKLFLEGHDPKRGKSGLAFVFNELIPGVRPSLGVRTHTDKTSHLRYLLPLRRSFLMDRGVRLHDQNDNEIFFNPFCKEIKNRNMLVTGTTGAGKSVFVNKLVHHLIIDHPIVILDLGGSFKRLTQYHGGNVLNSGINFMQFDDPHYLREIILSVADKDKFDKLKRGELFFHIKNYLEKANERNFIDFLNYLDNFFEGIRYYFEDIKEFVTDKPLEFFPILYVDIESYPKSIISPLIIYLLEYFKNIPEKEKILVFDECWNFLEEHSSYVEKCFRTFRKSGAFPIALTQGIKDFKGKKGDLSLAITNTSNFKVYFPQELDVGGELTQDDIDKVNSLDFEKGIFSDCYLKTTDNKFRKVIRNYLTPLEHELFHTEAGESVRLDRFLAKNTDFFENNKKAIDAFVGLKYAQDTISFNNNDSHIWS